MKEASESSDKEKTYELPDGNIITVGSVLEQFKATGVVPSLHACATLIRAYGHARRLDRAWILWRELTEECKVTSSEEVFFQYG